MNYGQLKQELINLGFADDEELSEFGTIVTDAINRAITEINLTVIPIIGTYEIEQDGSEEGLKYYDMTELTCEDGVIKFLDFTDTPVKVSTDYRRFNDYEIENGNTIVLDGSIAGTFRVFYKKAHEPITTETTDSHEIELPLRAHILVPLLTAYYVWLEDEKSKAVDYYNQFEKLSQSFMNKKARITLLSGGI